MKQDSSQQTTTHNIRLTSAEISNLWGTYIANSMSVCVLKHFYHHCEDEQIKEVVKYALSLSEKHVHTVAEIFNHEKFPLPVGFTDEDVDLSAPRLYADTFYLNYLHQTTKSGYSMYTIALPNIARADVRDFFSECISSLTELYNRIASLSLAKGVFIRPPYVPIPNDVEFVQSSQFLAGFLGRQRAINTLEITHVYSNIQSNALGRALIVGFSQVTKHPDVRHYFLRGKEIATHHIDTLSKILHNEDLPSPMTWDHDVMESTTPPFSDKLMLFHINGVNALSIFNYGAALSGAQRHDLNATYSRLMAQVGLYAEAGARLMIRHGWLEQTPLAADRPRLARV